MLNKLRYTVICLMRNQYTNIFTSKSISFQSLFYYLCKAYYSILKHKLTIHIRVITHIVRVVFSQDLRHPFSTYTRGNHRQFSSVLPLTVQVRRENTASRVIRARHHSSPSTIAKKYRHIASACAHIQCRRLRFSTYHKDIFVHTSFDKLVSYR